MRCFRPSSLQALRTATKILPRRRPARGLRRIRGKKTMRKAISSVLVAMFCLSSAWGAKKGDFLNDDETEELREAQDPSARIEKYLTFAENRLERFDDYRTRPADPSYDIPGYLETELDEYVHITDALKDWIEDHFDKRDDMREGLKKIVE